MTRPSTKSAQWQRNILTMLIQFGPEMSFSQRIVYALVSLILSAVGLMFLGVVSESWRSGDLLTALLWLLLAIVILAIGVAGLVNVLRFPKAGHNKCK